MLAFVYIQYAGASVIRLSQKRWDCSIRQFANTRTSDFIKGAFFLTIKKIRCV